MILDLFMNGFKMLGECTVNLNQYIGISDGWRIRNDKSNLDNMLKKLKFDTC